MAARCPTARGRRARWELRSFGAGVYRLAESVPHRATFGRNGLVAVGLGAGLDEGEAKRDPVGDGWARFSHCANGELVATAVAFHSSRPVRAWNSSLEPLRSRLR